MLLFVPVLFVEYFDAVITVYQGVKQKEMVLNASVTGKMLPPCYFYSRKKTYVSNNLNMKYWTPLDFYDLLIN